MLKLFSILLISVALMKVSATEIKAEESTTNISSVDSSKPRILILAEAAEKVLHLKVYALKAALEESQKINEYKKEIKSVVKVSLENIRDQLNDLNNEVKNATTLAKKSRKNISSCIRAEKRSNWRKIRNGRILKCQKSFSFDILKLKIAQLAYVKVKAASIIPTCVVLHPISNKKLKSCIERKISDTYSSANLIKYNIDDDASNIYGKASDCIEDNLGNLDLDIEQISIDFKKCVKNKLREI